MKSFITVIVLALTWNVQAQSDALMQDAITNPSLSIRCRELHRERGDKVKTQQRLNALLQRSQDVIKKTPKSKETLHARLNSNQVRVRNELHLVNIQIETMEENIIRSGCPGIALQ
jgi:hypothetical protein